jgi:DNA invertase Pin-like site-specific DNA recombinase
VRAAVYTRQSLDRDGAGAAVTRQLEDCRALAAERGWTIAKEYSDNDTSASNGKVRPGYARMLGDAAQKRFDVVIAWHPDRLARRLVDLEDLIVRAQRDGFKIATVTGDLDLSNDMGRLVGRILASVASAEVERKGARQRRALLQSAQQGKPAGGHRPVGYEPDGIKVRRDEARHIKKAYRDLLAGASLRGIAAEWNRAGFRSTRGGEWRSDSVRYVLLNPRYAGLRAHRGEVIGKAVWRPVVDEETWQNAKVLLENPKRRTTPDTRRKYLLSGLARCHCGALMVSGRTTHGVRTYKCSKLAHLSRGAEPIDALIREVVTRRLARPDAAELLVDRDTPDLDNLRDEAVAVRGRLDELAQLYSDGTVTAAQLTGGTASLRQRLQDLELRMAHGMRTDVLADLVKARRPVDLWDVLDIDRKRAVVDTLMTVTLLSPGRGARHLDPDTVRIDWRAS